MKRWGLHKGGRSLDGCGRLDERGATIMYKMPLGIEYSYSESQAISASLRDRLLI